MKRLMTAALAAVSFALPVSAEIQPGTYDLLDTVEDHLTVKYNTGSCSQPGVVGSYKLGNKTLTLCPGLEATADDHDTVRHEVWHAIQHCLGDADSYSLTPVFKPNTPDWWKFVGADLTVATAGHIQDSYPKSAWDVEYEAFVMAQTLTSSEIEGLFIKSCVK